MTIQEQLRREAARHPTMISVTCEMAAAAADRIDALEAALRYVVQYERDMSPDYGLIPPWALAARDALDAS